MQNMLRKPAPQFQLERLEKRHVALKEQIAELDGQRHLTHSEQLRVQSLKKERLATKDELIGLRRLYGSD